MSILERIAIYYAFRGYGAPPVVGADGRGFWISLITGTKAAMVPDALVKDLIGKR